MLQYGHRLLKILHIELNRTTQCVVDSWNNLLSIAVKAPSINIFKISRADLILIHEENVMDVVFSVCIVKRGAVGARVWEV